MIIITDHDTILMHVSLLIAIIIMCNHCYVMIVIVAYLIASGHDAAMVSA